MRLALRSGDEQHSRDGTRFIRKVPDGWELWFDSVPLGSLKTREEARRLMRAIKEDPGLAAVAAVQLS